MLTTDKKARKETPIARGVLDYFPDAIAAVAQVSYIGNQQHNPGEELHWDKSKSNDHADCVARHLIERGSFDNDGLRHTAKAAWRVMALLQTELDSDRDADAYYEAIKEVVPEYRGGLAPKGDPRKGQTATEAPVQYFAGTPIHWVSSLDSYERDVHEMKFTPEPEPERTLPSIPQGDLFNQARMRLRLRTLNCSDTVSRQIAGGASFVKGSQYVYIAGPMRGYPEFNFPAFDAARDQFLQNGWNVISPADIDRANKIDATEHPTGDASEFDQRVFVYRDFYALFLLAHLKDGAIAMLPGWEKSTGAVAEFFLARWLGLKVLDARSGQPLAYHQFQSQELDTSIFKFLIGQK